MQEWTEQQEQQMIALAKEGDPKANYELSLWALRRGEEEPGESRWNRLAAKCLVKAAQAGYGPAQDRMAELLRQSQGDGASPAPAQSEAETGPARHETGPDPAQEQSAVREPVQFSDARAAAQARRSRAPAPESTARRPSHALPDQEDYDDEEGYGGEEEEDDLSPRPRLPRIRRNGAGRDRQSSPDETQEQPSGSAPRWGERQWRRMEFICVAVCAALLVLIAVMIITSHSGGSSAGNGSSAIPPADVANAAATEAPAMEEYPSDETLAAIQAADLEVYPADTDFVTMPTTATVKVDSQSLRLRKGPSTTYAPPICSMDDGTVVDVFAIKNNWSLVLYDGGEDGPVYGWCSSEYLIVTSGAADSSSVG